MFYWILTCIMGIYMKTNINIRQIRDDFFLETQTFPNQFVSKNQKKILYV
jgi:hypothetical protein